MKTKNITKSHFLGYIIKNKANSPCVKGKKVVEHCLLIQEGASATDYFQPIT